MDLNQLHFAYPVFLWAALVVPLVWMVFFLFYRSVSSSPQLEKFIDRHLLPYLLIGTTGKRSSFWKTLVFWSMAWLCLTFALAGPRWNFKEIETFSKDQSLVILLDLSESMNAKDLKPSRLARAKQKIEDILNLSKGVKIGLIAFAADPHMITPLTEDKETIRHLLPSLGTDLVFVQGSQLSSALDMASKMLEAEPGNNKSILVLSDGGFEDASALVTVKKMAENGVIIHAMGVGTSEGAPILDHEDAVIKKNGMPIISKLEKERLSEISRAGKGRYLEVHYSDHEEAFILNELAKRAETQLEIGKKNQLWDERFYLWVFPVLPLILFWFRRSYVFLGFLFLFQPLNIQAVSPSHYLLNSEQQGKQALDEGDYTTAGEIFQDCYRKGVALYKAGDFAKAEEMFRMSSREEVACQATYNRGNACVQQQKLKEAVAAYEEVLKKWPDHQKAKENLELVKKMLEQQKQDPSNSDQENPDDKKDSQKDQNQEKNNQENQQSDKQDQESEDSQNDSQEQEPPQDEKQDLDPSQEEKSDEQDSHDDNDIKDEEEKPEDKSQSNQDLDKDQDEEKEQENQQPQPSQEEEQELQSCKSQEDQEADFWLNRITNDPKKFLKNKFYIESKKNGTTKGIDPW